MLGKGFGKMGLGGFGKKAAAANDDHGLLEGISTLHSWIKSQTMIKPNARGGRKHEPLYEQVMFLMDISTECYTAFHVNTAT